MIRAILFDFNGILVDDEPLHLELFQQVLGEEGVQLEADTYYRDYVGFDDRGCFSAVLAAADQEAEPQRLSRLIARKAAYYRQRVRASGFPVFPGAAELIASTAGAGLTLGVVSGALRDEIEGALAQLDVRDRFKTVVAAEDVAHSKPDPEGYRRGLQALNAQPPLPARLFHPHEVLAIEDTAAGLAAAAGAGISTLGVAHTHPAEELTGADQVVPSLVGVEISTLRELFPS